MAVAFALLFDAALEARLADATRSLYGTFGGMDLLGRKIRPHITLGIFDEVDRDAALPVVAQHMTCSPIRVQIASAGSFGGPAGVVFLAPVVTPRLLDLHARVHAALGPHVSGAWPHYVPRAWVPHVTLAHDVALDQVGQAMGAARELPLPLAGTAQELWVLDAGGDPSLPVETHSTIPLGPPQ